MGFREAVFAKALDLLKHPAGEALAVAPRQHAVDELALELLKPAPALPSGHGAAQLIGLAGGEASGDHGQFDHLLLEDGHPQGALQHLAHGLVGVGDVLLAIAAAQVGMHHVALDGAGPDDGHFDDQIVEAARPQARQHGHLRPGLHLKDADAVALLQHLIGAGLLPRDPIHSQGIRALVAPKAVD